MNSGHNAPNNPADKEKRALLARMLKEASGKCRIVPLSFAQQRLWFLDRLEPNSASYSVPAAVRLEGPLDVAALEKSISGIIRRHEALRTTFATVEGEPVQIVSSPAVQTLSITDLQGLSLAERTVEVQRLINEEARRPFDLSQGPLMRFTLLRLSPEEYVALLTMHHIISDGWSIGVFIREMAALYEAFSTGRSSPLPDLPIQYADFAVWQRQWLQGEVLEQQLGYWKNQLADVPVLQLPTDRPRPARQTYAGAHQTFILAKTLTEALKALSQQEGATLFMTLLAAFQTLLYRYTGQADISIGSGIANRNRAETEGLIGFFVNTLVMRTDLSGNPGFRELLGRVRGVALAAYAHQDVPFERLVEELRPARHLNHTPLFHVMFILQNTPASALAVPGLVLTPLVIDNGTAKFDLTLSLTETEQGLVCSFEYNTDLFAAVTIARMAEHFQTLLAGVTADPARRLSELPLLTEVERHRLLVEWNDTRADYPGEACIHQLFEAQAERTPAATAAVLGDTRLTYAALNARANQLAHHLRTMGVGPDTLVGVCLERSLDLLVGLLGILKAGGAYVPFDPAYPQERLAFMLADTQAPVLLTQERLAAGLPEHRARVVRLDTEWDLIVHESADNPVSGTTIENLAYIDYTSGSTGKPKGVEVRHRGVVRLLFGTDYARLDAARTLLHALADLLRRLHL